VFSLAHQQYFADEAAVQRLLTPYFRYVAVRTVNYTIGQQRNFARRELFWRCSDNRESIPRDAWKWASVAAE
jgi:hypothetical protein